MLSVLIKKNLPHVVSISDTSGETEILEPVDSVNLTESDLSDIMHGVHELHEAGFTVMDIKIGRSQEGIVKITDPSTFGYMDQTPMHTRYNVPETQYVKFKSDIWCLGCFLLGKNIPKRFHKSQELLDKFILDQPEYIKLMLKINPAERVIPITIETPDEKCLIQ
jgi:serine/threonine protein kinase